MLKVKASDLKPDFKFEVAKTVEGRTILRCFQCGMCSTNCPYSELLDVKPHQITKMVLLGMREQVLSCRAIWVCSTCYMCEERCPQDVELANVMFALMNIAAREKGVPEGLKSIGQQIFNTGYAVEVTRHRGMIRERLGLPERPEVNVEALREHCKKTGFDKLIQSGR